MSAESVSPEEMMEAPVGSVMYDRQGDKLLKYADGWVYVGFFDGGTIVPRFISERIGVPAPCLYGPYTWGQQ